MPGAQISNLSWHSRGRTAWSSVVLALIALTLGLYEFAPRYRPSDQQLLENPDFRQDLAEWWTTKRVRPDPRRSGTVVLESGGDAVGTWMRQTVELAGTPAAVIVRAQIAADIVDPEDGRKGGAWMILGHLVGSSDTSPYWEKGAFEPYLTTSSHGWWDLEASLAGPLDYRRLTFEAGVVGAAGTVLRIADLAVLEASEHPAFRTGRLALMVAWGLTAVWGSALVFRALGSGRARLACALLLGTAALGLLMPESATPHWASAQEATGHGLLFFLLAFTFRLHRPQEPFWLSFGVLTLVAAASEVVQSFVPGRGPELNDWLADLGGILAGLVLFAPALRLYRRILGRDRVR